MANDPKRRSKLCATEVMKVFVRKGSANKETTVRASVDNVININS